MSCSYFAEVGARDCTEDARISLIRSLIWKAPPRTTRLNNYACDEEAHDMKERYLKATYGDGNGDCVFTDLESLR